MDVSFDILFSNITRPSFVVDRVSFSGLVLLKTSHALRRKIDGTMISIGTDTLSERVIERRILLATDGSRILRSFLHRLILTNAGNATLARDNVSTTSDPILRLRNFLERVAESAVPSTAETLKRRVVSLLSLISN